MGFFESVSNSFNRGVNTVNRSGKTAQLNLQLRNLMSQRQNLAAQLGASLYEDTRHNPELTAGREALYDGIASIDAQRASIEAEIEQLRAEQAAQTAAAQTYRCPRCGSTVAATDLFCMGCGLPIAEVLAGQQTTAPASGGRACPNCGAPLAAGDLFCMNCGTRVEDVPTSAHASGPSSVPAASGSQAADSDGATRKRAAHATTESGRARVIDVPDPADVPSTARAGGGDASTKPTCPNCGAEVAPGEKFCSTCGHRLV